MNRAVVAAIVAVAVLTCVRGLEAQELTPVYYESFDDGKEEGVVGKAAKPRPIDARGKIDLDRGTLALFVRSDAAPAISEWDRVVGINGMRGSGYWGMIAGFDQRLHDFVFNLYDVGRYAPPLKMESRLDRWKPGQWHHLAAVWDRFEGVTVYEDGKRVASNWGEHRWEWNFTPERLVIGGAADELYFFSECLSDEQIAQLAAGQKPTGSPIPIAADEVRRAYELDRMGWSGSSVEALPRVEAGKGVTLSFARVYRVIDAKRPNAQLFEGFHDTTWPLDMYGASTKGRRAVVSLDPAGGYDRARVFVQRGFEGELAQEVQGVDRTLLPIRTQRATIVHATLPQPMQATELVLKRQHGMLGQLDLYRAEPLKKAPAGKSLVSYAIAKADQLPDDMTGLTLQAQTPVRFWNFVAATQEKVEPWTLSTPAFGGFQGVTEPPTTAQAYDGAVITLSADNITAPTPVRVVIKEPVHGMRDWLIADVVLEPRGKGRQSWTIQVKGRPVVNMPPLAVPKYLKDGKYADEATPVPGVGFGFSVTAGADVNWVFGKDGTAIAFTTMDMSAALPAATEDQVEFMREAYAEGMEGHGYGDHRMVIPTRWLAVFAPDRMEFRQMYERMGSPKWFVGIEEKVQPLVMPERKNDTGAPEWAFWQMQAMNEHRRMLHRLIDLQQVETGEFGGIWNDDTDHVENWIEHILCMDDDGKVADAYRKLTEGLWNLQLDQGVGKYTQDVCHFYEEGMGTLAMQALFDYGDPTVMSRLLTVCSHYDRWIEQRPDGTCWFKSEYISINGAWLDREFKDTSQGGHKADQLVPAGYLVWYNRHPAMTKLYSGFTFKPGGFHGSARAYSTDIAAARQEFAKLLATPGGRDAKAYLYYMDEVGLTDEVRKLHAVEFQAPGPIAHYWGAHDTDRHYFNWRITGDIRWLVESYKRVCEWAYSHDWLNVDARPSMDRNPLPRYSLVRARMGNLAANRGASGLTWPMFGISYVKGADDVAALVTENLETKLTARFYPFVDGQHEMQLRLWRLRPGRYTMTVSRDANDDGVPEDAIETREVQVTRGSFLDLSLPGRQCSIVSFTPIDTREFVFDRPDPAVGPGTVDLVYAEHLVVKVYNLGTKPVENLQVRVTDARSGRTVLAGEQTIARIDPPLDMKPKYVGVEFKNINANAYGHLIIEIDPEHKIDDLNPYNNRVELRF